MTSTVYNNKWKTNTSHSCLVCISLYEWHCNGLGVVDQIAAPWTGSNKIQLYYDSSVTRNCLILFVGLAWPLLIITELAELFVDQYKSTGSISGPLHYPSSVIKLQEFWNFSGNVSRKK